jgi:hypothetical protein
MKCPKAIQDFPGKHRGKVVRDVPLSMIAIPDVWSPHRYEDAYRLLKERGSIPPIDVYWRKEIGKFGISDGIHRTNAARDLGYTGIPAQMYPSEAKILDKPQKLQMTKGRMGR